MRKNNRNNEDRKAADEVAAKLAAEGYQASVQEIDDHLFIGFGLCFSHAHMKREKVDAIGIFRFGKGRVVFTVHGPEGTAIPPQKWDSAGMLCDMSNSHLTVPFLRLSRPDGNVEVARDLPYGMIDNDEEFTIFWKGAVSIYAQYGLAVIKTLQVDIDKFKDAMESILGLADDNEDDDDDDDKHTGDNAFGGFLRSISECIGSVGLDDSDAVTDDLDKAEDKKPRQKRRPGRPRKRL